MTDTPPPAPPTTATPLSADDDKLWASLAHFGNILGFLPPLLIWLILKDRGYRTNIEGKEALNWAINVAGFMLAASILTAFFSAIPFIGWIIATPLSLAMFTLFVVNIVFAIMGGVRVQNGGGYRYPINIRWIK